ncbi:GAF domain-containing protein [Streptomyces sp. NPDC005167]
MGDDRYMSDDRCAWCEAPLPESAGPGRRYCRQAHRQAAWRARRRWQTAAEARQALEFAQADLLTQVQAATQQASDSRPGRGAEVCHVAAVAQVPGLADQLVRWAVLADRRTGASWAQIGAGLGISAETARSRFRRLEGSLPGAAREVEGTRELAGFGSGSGTHLLAAALEQFMRDAGASGCLVYLLPPGERVLRLAVLAGVPRQVAAHWTQVPLAARTPATDAVRERRLVWIGGQEEMARHYPQMALALPYPFSAAAAPITTGTTVWGALVVRWPSSHPSPLTRHERNAIHTSCRRLGLLLRQAADRGHPLLPGSEPQVLAAR